MTELDDMYVYQNRNNPKQVVKSTDGPLMRLERLGNWDRIVGEDLDARAKRLAEAELDEIEVPEDLSGLGEAQVAADGADVPQGDRDAEGNDPAITAESDPAVEETAAATAEASADGPAEDAPEATEEAPKPVAKKTAKKTAAKKPAAPAAEQKTED